MTVKKSAVQSGIMAQLANQTLHWIEHHGHGCSVNGVQLSEFGRYVLKQKRGLLWKEKL